MSLFKTSTITFCVLFCFSLPSWAQTNTQDDFWANMERLCGKSFQAIEIIAPQSDTVFKDKQIIAHFRICAGANIVVHLHVGEERSRTWIFSRTEQGIVLKHDHRKPDGSEDKITQYGGTTTNTGSTGTQFFPADEETRQILPAAAGNVWWIEIKNDTSFTYHLHRLGTDRKFSITFDTSSPVEHPPLPWGWE
jgi:hypothetical protein